MNIGAWVLLWIAGELLIAGVLAALAWVIEGADVPHDTHRRSN